MSAAVPSLIIVGVGPGIGTSVVTRFAKEGVAVGAIARRSSTVGSALDAARAFGVPVAGATADAGDEHALRAALDAVTAELGVPEVVVYNAAIIQADAVGELSVEEHQRAWAVNVVGAVTTAGHLLPAMADAGGGTYVITGGMPAPVPGVTSLSLGKAGVRALAHLLDAQFRDAGIHVATVTVGGAVAPGTAFDPDDIAERYWDLHAQPAGAWDVEVPVTGPRGSR